MGDDYIDLSDDLGDDYLSPLEKITRRLYFSNPYRKRFTFGTELCGMV